MRFYTKEDELESVLMEKHVPIIKIPEKIKANEEFEVIINVGEKVPHPNVIEHHIKWIQIFAIIEGRVFNPAHIATFDFEPTFSEPKIKFRMKLDKSATLVALKYCNLHGVWENSIKIKVE